MPGMTSTKLNASAFLNRWTIAVLRLSLIALVTTTAGVRSLEAANPKPKPNIVFLLADDLGFMDIGCKQPGDFLRNAEHRSPGGPGDEVHRRVRGVPGVLAHAGQHPDRQVSTAHRGSPTSSAATGRAGCGRRRTATTWRSRRSLSPRHCAGRDTPPSSPASGISAAGPFGPEAQGFGPGSRARTSSTIAPSAVARSEVGQTTPRPPTAIARGGCGSSKRTGTGRSSPTCRSWRSTSRWGPGPN